MTLELDARESQTRRRLLEAAGEVFADRGFRAATIREICRRADANIAAVNYHFGDKDGLYAAVLTFAHRSAIEEFPIEEFPIEAPAGSASDGSSPNRSSSGQRLFHFVHAMLRRMLNTGRPAWHGKLMAREMVEPSAALDVLVRDSIRPQSKLLEQIVRESLGPDFDAAQVQRAINSIVGQCVFYRHCREMLLRLAPDSDVAGDSEKIESLARHIAGFSMAGLEAIREAGSGSSGAGRGGAFEIPGKDGGNPHPNPLPEYMERAKDGPHPDPLPEYRARGKESGAAVDAVDVDAVDGDQRP